MGSPSPRGGSCHRGKDGVEKQLPLEQARKFSVFEREKITLAIGDRVRFTKSVKHRGHRFLNNELRTVMGIDEAKIIFDKGEIVRNGAALHIDQGIAVTSHASQAKTVDQVIVSVPVRAFSQANEAQFYVSMSRARWAMHSSLIARWLCEMPSPGRASGFPLGSSSTVPRRTELKSRAGQAAGKRTNGTTRENLSAIMCYGCRHGH